MQSPFGIARLGERLAQTLGRPGERRGRLQPERLLHLSRRLPGHAHGVEGKARIEARELRDVGIGRAAGAERLEGTLVVALPVAKVTDVIPEGVEAGIAPEHVLEDDLRFVVPVQ